MIVFRVLSSFLSGLVFGLFLVLMLGVMPVFLCMLLLLRLRPFGVKYLLIVMLSVLPLESCLIFWKMFLLYVCVLMMVVCLRFCSALVTISDVEVEFWLMSMMMGILVEIVFLVVL